ncbi:PqqD family protein [Ensifer sp. BR816]|uniref:PqqD family protein n=1 Tax=Rhizobium sp. (strain BR816) TaxID=1057002 RepID=UPI00036C8DC6|nr:PqqD family protein [Ensifer sp. BR816]
MIHQEAIGRMAAQGPADDKAARFVVQAQLVRIKEQNILFSPSQRAIFALNDTAVDIWRSLQEGMPPAAISRKIARGPFDTAEAYRHVEAALKDWEQLGLIRPCPPSACAAPDQHVSQMLAVAGRTIQIVYPAAHAFPASTVFKHLESRNEIADIVLQPVEHGERIRLFRNGEWVLSCSPEELATVLKGELLSDILKHAKYELALHTAALLKRERLLLLCGAPGAGKTTLTLALARAGFGFVADDVTLLDADGLGVGLPFAPAIKPGAWPLLAEGYPALDRAPIFRRPDSKRVRYVLPQDFVQPRPSAIGWVILLRRDRVSRPRLDPVDTVGALRGLLSGAFAPGQELGNAAFDVLSHVIRSAEVYCLTYSDLQDAVELVRRACR